MAMIRDGKVYRNVPEQVQKNKEDIEHINEIITDLGTVLVYKGSVPTYADLPTEDAKIGDFYNVLDTGDNYAWDGEAWDKMSATVDLSHLVTLDTDQTITGVKTISSSLNFNKDGTDSITWKVVPNNYHGIDIRRENTTLIGISGGNISTHTHNPYTTATYDLGSSDAKWKDLYLSGSVKLQGANYSSSIVNADNRLKFYYADVERLRIGNLATTSYNSIYPGTNNEYDLGSSANQWKDLYLSGSLIIPGSGRTVKINAGNGYYVSFNLNNNEVLGASDSALLSPNTARDLGSASYNWKDLYLGGGIKFKDGTNTSNVTWGINETNSGAFYINRDNVTKVGISDVALRAYGIHLLPATGNTTYDLGNSNSLWHDLYLNGNITDGTNSISVQDIPSKSAENTFEEDIYLDGADLYVTGTVQATNYAENLTGYSVYTGTKAGITFTPEYVKVSKMGNMLNIEWLENVTRTGDVANNFFSLGYLYMPQEVYNKITQYTSGSLANCVKNLKVQAYDGPNSSFETNCAITAVVNGSLYALQPYIYNVSGLALNTTYKVRVQTTIMLGSNIAA